MNKLMFLLFLILFSVFTTPAMAAGAEWTLERQMEICTSLNRYQNEYQRCTDSGFRYVVLDVEYPTIQGDLGTMDIRQILWQGRVQDVHITSASIACADCLTDSSHIMILYI